MLGVYNGATTVINRAHTRTDALNLTNVWDNVAAANNQSYWANPANRLQNASGPWGAKTFYYDGVGNRTQEISTPSGGATTTDVLGYSATDNRVVTITRGASTVRSFTYDNAGNLLTDNSLGGNKSYTYNHRNRLTTATVGALTYGYTYNALEQLAIRTQTSPATTTHFIHDHLGNVIAETAGGGATGAAGTVREYIWLPEAEIAPTSVRSTASDPGSRTAVDRPLAVVDAVNATPVTYFVHVDHLHRPVKMTDAAKATVWDVVWLPWGGAHSITGTATLEARLPGQWFQAETGLHYNWHRSYDPTLGRYTQPDPLGFVDGPSVFGYAGGSPLRYVDKDGRQVVIPAPPQILIPVTLTGLFCQIYPESCRKLIDVCLRVGGGRRPPPPPKKDDDPCDKQFEQDNAICDGFVKVRYGLRGRAICLNSARERYSECIAGGSPKSIKTPLGGFETPL